jgi:hypothetical protein
MTGSKWAVTGTDTGEGVIHVAEFAEASLEIFQENDKAPGPQRIGTIMLRGPAPQGDDPPWGLAWVDEEVYLSGPARLTIADFVKVESFAREKDPNLLVRDRGGKDYEKEKLPVAERLRGGYTFAPSDLEDGAYLGHASVKRDRSIASVELVLAPAEKQRHRMYFLYPTPARQVWMYDEHNFKLSYVLTCGDRTWRADGPTVQIPTYEFIHDPSDTGALKDNLKAEYGTPAKNPPLYARDYVGLLTGLSSVSLALSGLLPLVVSFINSKIEPGHRYTINAAELVCTFLSDGAVDTFRDAIVGRLGIGDLLFDGYQDVGIDRFIDAYEGDQGPIRVFTFDQLRLMLAAGRSAVDLIDGKDGAYKKFDKLPLPLALYAIAALYGQAKHHFAQDVEDPKIMGRWAMPVDELPLHVQFFWSTIYYQTGLTNGRGTLGRRGLEYHDIEWPYEDDPGKYKDFEKYNANWRTASFRIVQASLGLPSLGGMGPPTVELPGLPGLPSLPF